MNSNEYQEQALRTNGRFIPENLDLRMLQLILTNLQLIEDVGTTLDADKKWLFYGRLPVFNFAVPLAFATPEMLDRLGTEEGSNLLHCILGLNSEIAELNAAFLKYLQGEGDSVNFAEELGDLAWYSAVGAKAAGFRLGEILAANIAKLQARFPDKFDAAKAIDRDTSAERAVLEELVYASTGDGEDVLYMDTAEGELVEAKVPPVQKLPPSEPTSETRFQPYANDSVAFGTTAQRFTTNCMFIPKGRSAEFNVAEYEELLDEEGTKGV